MKKARFREEQMVKILREADAAPVAEVAKKYGVSDVTISGGRKRYDQLETVDVKRLRHLEQRKARLKKLVADRDLDLPRWTTGPTILEITLRIKNLDRRIAVAPMMDWTDEVKCS